MIILADCCAGPKVWAEEDQRVCHGGAGRPVAVQLKGDHRNLGLQPGKPLPAGGLIAEGVLVLLPQGWLGSRDTVLHSGEGAVSTARWAGNLIAWANDRGVKARSQRL